MRKTSEFGEAEDRALMRLARYMVMCLESNWKYDLRVCSPLPISSSGESTATQN